MEYKVVNALSRDVEREHLNKILKHISGTLSSVSTGGLTEAQVRAWIAESMPVIPSARPITVTLTGDATGSGSGTTSISIPVDLTGNFIEDAPSDSLPYWRQDGTWQNVPFPLLSLAYLSPSGFASYNEEELEWNSRILTGTNGNITVTNGDGILGDPVFDLAPVADSGTGALLAITRDSFGRVTGTKPATITGTSGNITVANGNAVSGLPTINLATVPDGEVAPTLYKITRDTFGRVTDTQAATAADVPIAKLGSATWDNVQEYINVMNSPGLVEGGSFSDAGSGNLAYGSMRIAIRPTDDDISTLYMADIAAGSVAIPNDSATRFVGVQYNAGVPNVVIKTSDTWNYDTEFPLGEVANLGGTLFPLFNPFKVGDPITNIIQRFEAQSYAIRSAAGGLELSTDGTTRNLAMTAGIIWTRLNDHNIAARNSPTVPLYRVAPTGGTSPLSFTPGITAWPNTQYLSGTTLTTMGNNKWAVLWVFVNVGTGAWGFAHGTAEYNNAAAASVEQVPAYLTANFLRQNMLVGRLIFEKNATTAIIESAFTRVFSTQAVSNHNQLSGLQGGVLNEYYHLTNDQLSRVPPASGTSARFLRGDNVWSNGILGSLGIGTPTPGYIGFSTSISVESSTNVGYEMVSSRPDASGVLLGAFAAWYKSNNASHNRICEVQFQTDSSSPTPNQRGGAVTIWTKPDGSSSLVRRLEINSSGLAVFNSTPVPQTDNSFGLGAPVFRWSELFAANGTINTSDAREKTTVRRFTAPELEASIQLGKEIGVYRWLSMVAEKGDSAREHIGMTVQRCIEIMELHGLDAFNYGFVCYDEWEELEEILGEDGEVVQEARPAGDRYSFRMDELAMFILAGQNQRLEILEEKLSQM